MLRRAKELCVRLGQPGTAPAGWGQAGPSQVAQCCNLANQVSHAGNVLRKFTSPDLDAICTLTSKLHIEHNIELAKVPPFSSLKLGSGQRRKQKWCTSDPLYLAAALYVEPPHQYSILRLFLSLSFRVRMSKNVSLECERSSWRQWGRNTWRHSNLAAKSSSLRSFVEYTLSMSMSMGLVFCHRSWHKRHIICGWNKIWWTDTALQIFRACSLQPLSTALFELIPWNWMCQFAWTKRLQFTGLSQFDSPVSWLSIEHRTA